MIACIAYMMFSTFILLICESGLIDVSIYVRLTVMFFYIPVLLVLLRIILVAIINILYPLIESVEDYFEKRDEERAEKKYGFK